jgi:hypothetical protein
MLNFLIGLVLAPKAGKRILSNLGGQFETLGANVRAFINMLTFVHVVAFISNLGPNKKPNMFKVGPKFFGP